MNEPTQQERADQVVDDIQRVIRNAHADIDDFCDGLVNIADDMQIDLDKANLEVGSLLKQVEGMRCEIEELEEAGADAVREILRLKGML